MAQAGADRAAPCGSILLISRGDGRRAGSNGARGNEIRVDIADGWLRPDGARPARCTCGRAAGCGFPRIRMRASLVFRLLAALTTGAPDGLGLPRSQPLPSLRCGA